MRVFFAVTLPESLQQTILNKIDEPKRILPTTIRWIEPAKYHITLQFLASIDEKDLGNLTSHVQQALTDIKPFAITLDTLEFFPSPKHPRVISLKIKENPDLFTLSKVIGEGIIAAGYEIERRQYRPHLTVAKVHSPIACELPITPMTETLSVNHVILLESNMSQHGSTYTPLFRFPL